MDNETDLQYVPGKLSDRDLQAAERLDNLFCFYNSASMRQDRAMVLRMVELHLMVERNDILARMENTGASISENLKEE